MIRLLYFLIILNIVSCQHKIDAETKTLQNDNDTPQLLDDSKHHAKVSDHPILTYLKEYKIKEEQVIYQFYEKFGFTDICIHHRMLCYFDSLNLDSSWKKLPISNEDLQKINSIENKIDTVTAKHIPIVNLYKEVFSDIHLEMNEFTKDSINDFKMKLLDGFYKVKDGTFQVYDNDDKCLYVESHSCK